MFRPRGPWGVLLVSERFLRFVDGYDLGPLRVVEQMGVGGQGTIDFYALKLVLHARHARTELEGSPGSRRYRSCSHDFIP